MNNRELSKRILEKVETKIAISNFQKEKKDMKNYRILKMVAMFTIVIGLTAGMVYAGNIIYENVFKKPKKIENFIEELKVSDEELNKIITEEEAKNMGNDISANGITCVIKQEKFTSDFKEKIEQQDYEAIIKELGS